jgi:glycosyltransferase involved in cell wall biosynthesis
MRWRRRRRLLALLPFRDERRFLPGLFESLAGQVDGVVALDDGSADESRSIVESQPLLVELISASAGSREELNDGKFHRSLIEAAWNHDTDWLLGIDADERLELDFRIRAEAEIDRAEAAGQPALWVRFCELWDSPDRFRVDGVWGEKRKACLFRSDTGHVFHERRLHSIWAPWPPPSGEYPVADLRIYHLRMIRAEDRRARMERYIRLDPGRDWQAIGYDYLVDEDGLRLQPLEPGRDYVGRPAR